jgi:hypothetical protein
VSRHRKLKLICGVAIGMKVGGLLASSLCLLQAQTTSVDGSEPRSVARASAAASPVGEDGRTDVNLIAFVGRKIEARSVEPKPKKGEILLDAEYRLRYEVLQVVFGRYPKKQITFASYVHVGEPEWKKHEVGLVYVSKYQGRFVQQKYLFQALYPTADGRWAGCGDPYAGMPEIHRHGVKAEPIPFTPPVV